LAWIGVEIFALCLDDFGGRAGPRTKIVIIGGLRRSDMRCMHATCMLWLDSDGFPSKEWDKDPVGYFIENKGVIMFDHFPEGSQRDEETLSRIVDAFNDTSVRDLRLNPETGRLERTLINRVEFDDLRSGANCPRSKKCASTQVPMIHGFMHITNLDFYRQPKVMNGLKHILGDCFLCRSPDDQLAVTIPAAIYAPDKSWDMRLHGFDLKIHHNSHIDGQEKAPLGQRMFTLFWEEVGAQGFPSADKVCKITEGSR
jgi:hypothetical protein